MKLIHYLNDPTGHLAAQRADNVITGYIYTWPEQANVRIGTVHIHTERPYAVLLTPSEWRIETDQAVAREVATLHIYYLLPQPRLDFDATANEAIIDQCIAAATNLVARLRTDKRVAIVNANMQGLSLYDLNDRNLTGVRLSVTLRDNGGYCLTDYTTIC